MLAKKLAEALNKQLNSELHSSYIYLAMAAYCENSGMKGTAHWMLFQAQEEMGHAMRIYTYMNDQDARVTLESMKKPRNDFPSLKSVFEAALENEKKLSADLNALANLALSNKDNTTYSFLQWFLTEQVEEVATCKGLIDKLKLIGNTGYGLLMFDQELGKRQPESTPSSGNAQA